MRTFKAGARPGANRALTEEQVLAIWERRADGPAVVARTLGLPVHAITRIISGNNWRYLTGATPRARAVPETKSERFWRQVDRSQYSPGGCWLWLGHRNRYGYGHFSVGSCREPGSRRPVHAHRIAYELNPYADAMDLPLSLGQIDKATRETLERAAEDMEADGA
jgi:hypothetical protein